MHTLLSITRLFNLRFFLLGVGVVGLCALLWPDITSAQANGNITIGSVLERTLWTLVNVLFGWLVWVGGTLLDVAVQEYVIRFGTMYTGASGLGATIDRLWVVVRDIFNLTFIFGLVYIGLKMIFDSSNSSTRKMLVMLILAALLVNFSLFITKFVIDFSNVAAAQVATAFQAGGTGDVQISGRFMQLMGLTTILDVRAGQNIDFSKLSGGGSFGYIFGTMILYIIAAFVFLGGALLLMIRFAVLNIYMVLSPLMFIGWVFPSAAGVTREYWHGFLNRAFFAPAYLLMLYLAQSVLNNFALTGGAQGQANLASIFGQGDRAGFTAVVPPFVLTAVFLIAALIVAQKMGAQGASGVISMGKTLTGKAKKVVADRTVGATVRTGARILNSDTVTRANARLNTAQGWTGKLARAGVATVSLGALTRRNRQAVIQGSNSWSVAGSQTLAAHQKEDRDIRTTDAKILTAAKTQSTIDAGMNSASQLSAIRARVTSGTATPADLAALPGLEKIERDMISAISGLAVGSLEKLSPADWTKYAPHLTASQVEAAMKSDNIDEQSKNNMIAARQAAITAIVGSTGAVVTKELTKLTIDQIESMGDDWIRDNAHLFSHSQMDEIKKSKKFTPSQRNSFTSARDGWHTAAVTGTAYGGKPTNIEELFSHKDSSGTFVGDRKPEDIANLGSKVLLDPASAMFISAAALEAIASKKTLNPAERSALKANLLAYPGPRFGEIDAYLKSTEGVRYYT